MQDLHVYIPSHIQEAHPIKQGLKHKKSTVLPSPVKIQEAHPIKQGLKLG